MVSTCESMNMVKLYGTSFYQICSSYFPHSSEVFHSLIILLQVILSNLQLLLQVPHFHMPHLHVHSYFPTDFSFSFIRRPLLQAFRSDVLFISASTSSSFSYYLVILLQGLHFLYPSSGAPDSHILLRYFLLQVPRSS